MGKWLSRYSLPLRVALSSGLLAVILASIDLKHTGSLLLSAQPGWLLLALAVIALERLVMAYKWQVLLAARQLRVPLLRMLKICYLSNFLGAFLPSSLGVDALRSFSLYRYGTRLSDSVSSVLVDKLLALTAALLAPVLVVLWMPGSVPEPMIRAVVLGVAGCFAAGLLLVGNRRLVLALLEWLQGRLQRALWTRLWVRAQGLYANFHGYTAHRSTLAYVFALSLVFQALRVLGVYAIGLSLGLAPGIFTYFVFVPMIILLTMLPISVGGIGVREGAFVYFFTGAGVPAAEAVALALLLYLVSMVSVLPGAVIYLREGLASRPGPPVTPADQV